LESEIQRARVTLLKREQGEKKMKEKILRRQGWEPVEENAKRSARGRRKSWKESRRGKN